MHERSFCRFVSLFYIDFTSLCLAANQLRDTFEQSVVVLTAGRGNTPLVRRSSLIEQPEMIDEITEDEKADEQTVDC